MTNQSQQPETYLETCMLTFDNEILHARTTVT